MRTPSLLPLLLLVSTLHAQDALDAASASIPLAVPAAAQPLAAPAPLPDAPALQLPPLRPAALQPQFFPFPPPPLYPPCSPQQGFPWTTLIVTGALLLFFGIEIAAH